MSLIYSGNMLVFQVSGPETVELNVTMHCEACAEQLQRKILQMRGIIGLFFRVGCFLRCLFSGVPPIYGAFSLYYQFHWSLFVLSRTCWLIKFAVSKKKNWFIS